MRVADTLFSPKDFFAQKKFLGMPMSRARFLTEEISHDEARQEIEKAMESRSAEIGNDLRPSPFFEPSLKNTEVPR